MVIVMVIVNPAYNYDYTCAIMCTIGTLTTHNNCIHNALKMHVLGKVLPKYLFLPQFMNPSVIWTAQCLTPHQTPFD